MEASRRAKTEKSTSSSVKCEGFVHCALRMQWHGVRNEEYYLEVMCRLREVIHQIRTGLWENESSILHHDNALAQTSMLVRKVVRSIRNTTLKLCADCVMRFITNAQNSGKTYHGFCTMITHQLIHRWLRVSSWPKTKPYLPKYVMSGSADFFFFSKLKKDSCSAHKMPSETSGAILLVKSMLDCVIHCTRTYFFSIFF